MVQGQPVYNEKSKTLPVTITAVDAVTNLPVQGYVYEDTGYSTAPFLGFSGSTFNFTFWSAGASHNTGFRVYFPGYDLRLPMSASIASFNNSRPLLPISDLARAGTTSR